MRGRVRRRASPLVVAGTVASMAVQLLLITVGVAFLNDPSAPGSVINLLLWCLIGTGYLVAVVVVVGVSVRRPGVAPARLTLNPAIRLVGIAGTLIASLVGVGAAVQHVFLTPGTDLAPLILAVGVWAMLLSWGLLNWGAAQVYVSLFYSSPTPAMRFPDTPTPGLVEFVYFAFTIGTTFAASDVEVFSPRVRWRVVWHSIVSFLYNGLIIVLALGTLTGK